MIVPKEKKFAILSQRETEKRSTILKYILPEDSQKKKEFITYFYL